MRGSSCTGGDTYAYVYNPEARTLLYCDLFLDAHRLGRNSKAGIVIHKVSHLDVPTGDLAYGQGDVLGLGIDHPEQAVLNADTYEFLAEDAWRP